MQRESLLKFNILRLFEPHRHEHRTLQAQPLQGS
jgi:hypothetical protein